MPAAPTAPAGHVTLGFQCVPASAIPAQFRTQAGIPEGASVVAVNVQAGGPADAAGLKQFDIILKIAGQDLPPTKDVDASKPETIAAFVDAVAKFTASTAVGAKVEIVVQRDGKPVTLGVIAAAERGFLGFTPAPVALLSPKQKSKLGLKAETGVAVVRVTKGSPAEKAGLRVGDLLQKFAGKDVPSTKDVVAGNPESGREFAAAFGKISATTRPGTEVELVVERDGKAVTLHGTPIDQLAMQRVTSAAGDDEDGEEGEEDEGHEAPEKAPAPK